MTISSCVFSQIPLLDLEELDAHVHELWKDMASVEDLDASPQLKVEPSSIDFDTIRSVIILSSIFQLS